MSTSNDNPDKVYSISEVSSLTGVSPHLLRQWEGRFRQLAPRRSPTDKRLYTKDHINVVLRIKTLLKHEGMTTQGVRARLSEETIKTGHPMNTHEMLDVLDKIEDEARAIIRIADPKEINT